MTCTFAVGNFNWNSCVSVERRTALQDIEENARFDHGLSSGDAEEESKRNQCDLTSGRGTTSYARTSINEGTQPGTLL
jgi:hypothetical protein